MDEEFESFVITDPNLVDEGIDVSGLRTKTDTSLLGNIPELAGVQYEAFNPNRLTDLMRFYQTGLPTRSVSQPTTPPATGGGGSGGGSQAITPTTSITDGTNINTPGGLTQSGTFGGQPTFTTTPGTTVNNITGDITNPDGSYGGNINNEVALTGGTISPTTQPIDPTGMLPQTSESRFAATGTLSDPREKQDFITEEDVADPGFLDKIGLGQFNLGEALVKTAINTAIGKPVTFLLDFLKNNLPPQDPRQTELNKLYDVQDGTIQSGLMKGYNPVSGGGLYTLTGGRAGEEPTYGLQEAYQDRIDTIENTLADKYGMTAAEIADVKAGTYTGDVDTDLFERLNQLETDKAKEKSRLDLFSGDVDDRDQILENIVAQNRADRLGISGDIGIEGEDADRFGGGADITSGPITTDITSDQINEFGTAPQSEFPTINLGPKGLDQDFSTLGDDLSAELFGDNITGDSMLLASGDPITTKLNEQKDKLEAIKKSDAYEFLNQEQKDQLEEDLDQINQDLKLEEIKGQTAGLTTMTDARDKIDDFDTTPAPTPTPRVPDFISGGGGADRDPTPAPTPTPTVPDFISGGGGRDRDPAPSAPAPSGPPEADRRGGGGGGGGGKIVCTMMNKSYGFGSFRNKIWLRHSKGLAPEYQKGYHKIFLPLVKLSKKNIVLKKVLEHIAVHRTIDIRQESRGKVHLLGRVYRKILEPICYWVGKYAK